MAKSRASFNYEIQRDREVLFIKDLNGRTSVTNDFENVLTDILSKEGDGIKLLKVMYSDSYGDISKVVPHWQGDSCYDVKFV